MVSSKIFCKASWPRSSKKKTARLACSVRRTFSRSAALSCALYCAALMVLRTLPQRSGSQEAETGSEKIWLCRLGRVAEPPLPEPELLDLSVRFEEERARW